MTDTSSAREVRWLVVALVALLLHRLWLLMFGDIPLDLEETYYLFWSTAPDLGYYSKPPVVAWLLAAQSALFGTGVVAVKTVSLVLHGLTALVLYSLGRRLWSPAAGWAGAVTFFSLPLIGGLSLFTSTDAALHLCWALTLRFFVEARDRGHWHWWVATGIAAGLGLLSKYTMGLLAIGLLGYLLSSPAYRRLLTDPRLWLGVLVAALVWSPNLWWNAQNHFISFQHTADISQLDRALFHPDHLVEFLLPQWPLFGIVLAPLLAVSLWRGARDDRDRLLLWVSIPVLLVIALQALLAEANLNWASTAYVGLGLLAGARLWQHQRRWWLVAVLVNLTLLGVVQHYHTLAQVAGVELTRKTDPYFKRLGWRELGAELRPLVQERPGVRLVSSSRRLLAYLGYYAMDWPPRVASWNPGEHIRSQYDLRYNLKDMPAGPLLFVSESPVDQGVLRSFSSARLLVVLEVQVYRDLIHKLYVYDVTGFKGYGS